MARTDDNQSSWAAKIVAQYADEIPILHKLKKGEEVSLVTFKTDAKIKNIAEELTYKSSGLGNISETYRAAMNIGIRIIYHIMQARGDVSDKATMMVKSVMESDKYDALLTTLDLFLDMVSSLQKSHSVGLISAEDMDHKIAVCLNEIEARYGYELGRVARRNVDELRAGSSVTRMAKFTSGHGGYRER